MNRDKRNGAGAHLVSGHPRKMPAPRPWDGMRSDKRNGAGAHLVSGHPRKMPAPRLSIQLMLGAVSLIAATHAAAADQAPFRIQRGGNELIVARGATVADAKLAQLVGDRAGRGAPA